MFCTYALTARRSVANKHLTAGPGGFQPRISSLQAAWSWGLLHSSPTTCASDQPGPNTLESSEAEKSRIKSRWAGPAGSLWPADTAQLLRANSSDSAGSRFGFFFLIIPKTHREQICKFRKTRPSGILLHKIMTLASRLDNKVRVMGNELEMFISATITFLTYYSYFNAFSREAPG